VLISYLNVRRPTEEEIIDDTTDRHITFTNERLLYPSDPILSENELNIGYTKGDDIVVTPECYVTATVVSEKQL
jgi:hypothetical protein